MNRRGSAAIVVLAMLFFGGLGLAAPAPAAPPLESDPAAYDFGTLTVGAQYDQIEDGVTLRNNGVTPVTIDSIVLSGTDAAEFEIGPLSSCTDGLLMEPDQECVIDVRYYPVDAGASAATIGVTFDAGDPLTVPLTGEGSEPAGNAPVFAAPTSTAPVDGDIFSVVAGDVDGDGLDDLLGNVFGQVQNNLAVFPASADTTLGAPDLYDAGGVFSGNVSAGLIDGNGSLDAVVGVSSSARVFLNDGSGAMEYDLDLPTDSQDVYQTVGDFNDDGDNDVVVSGEGDSESDPNEYVGYLDFYPGDGEGGFGARVRTEVGDRSLLGMVTSDFDGDGKDDLAYTTFDRGRPVMMRSDGDGTFTRATVIGGSCGCGGDPEGISSSDLNGDGRDDITTALRFANRIETYLSLPDGTFSRRQSLRVPLVDGSFDTNPLGISSSDLNGDGIPDAVTADYLSDTVSFFTGAGDGTYDFARSETVTGISGPRAAAIGQFGSGVKADVSVADQAGSTFTFRNTGDPGPVPTPASVTFPDTPSDYESAPVTVELANVDGLAPMTVTDVGFAGGFSADFRVVDASDCTGAPTLVGDSCSIEIAFKPVGQAGERESVLNLRTNVEGGTDLVEIPVEGMALDNLPAGTVNPTSVSFGQVTLATAGPARNFVLTNTGNVPLETGATTVEGTNAGDFSANDACSNKTLAVNETCTVTTGFTPSALGNRSASVRIAMEFGDFVVPLSGTGVAATVPGISVQPSSLSFPSTQVDSTSGTRTVVVTSAGTAPLTVSGVTVGGANVPDFPIESSGCAGKVQPGATCSITLRFTPTTSGSRAASLEIASNTAGGVTSVPMTGTATAPPVPAPKVSFRKKPKKKYVIKTRKLKKVKVAFRSNRAGSKFQCRIDRKKFGGCRSPKVFRAIKPGKHTIRVRAKKGGKTGPAASVSFKVVRKR